MAVCIVCGNPAENCLCESCSKTVDREKLAEQIKQFEAEKKKALDEQQERHIKELKELILGRETKPKEESEELSYEDELMSKIRQKIKK